MEVVLCPDLGIRPRLDVDFAKKGASIRSFFSFLEDDDDDEMLALTPKNSSAAAAATYP